MTLENFLRAYYAVRKPYGTYVTQHLYSKNGKNIDHLPFDKLLGYGIHEILFDEMDDRGVPCIIITLNVVYTG